MAQVGKKLARSVDVVVRLWIAGLVLVGLGLSASGVSTGLVNGPTTLDEERLIPGLVLLAAAAVSFGVRAWAAWLFRDDRPGASRAT